MCDPYSAAIMLATKAGSSYLSGQAARQVGGARANVQRNLEGKLQTYRNASMDSYNKSLDASTPSGLQAGMNNAVAQRTAAYEGAIPEAQTIVPEAGSDAAKGAIAKALATGTAYSKNQAGLRAKSQGFGAATAGRDLVLGKSGTDIGVENNFARGQTGLADTQFQAANGAGARDANLAGIIDALGTVGSMAMGPISGSAPGYDASTGITWNTARVAPGSAGMDVLNPGMALRLGGVAKNAYPNFNLTG